MQGFGASGAWWAQYVGGAAEPDNLNGTPVRDHIAELLYNKETGIGMDIFRFNIGAGSLESGRGKFSNPWRRTASFETAPGVYDWNKDANAVYMMKKAVENGADEVILFVNSPPERLTKNHKSHLDKVFRDNIRHKDYAAFAKYVCDIAEHFVSEGVPVKYISPVNEPIWIWTGGQEGCHYHPWDLRPMFRCFAEELEKRPLLRDVMLSGPESGDLRFFNKSYIRFMLSDKSVRKRMNCIDTHSYFTHIKLPFIEKAFNDRAAFVKRYGKWAQKKYPDLPLKISEWTHMKGGRDAGMDSALEQAKIMCEDISLMNAASWQHWIAVSEVDFCDGLIYIDLPENTLTLTKRYYCFGNFTRFVKRGSVRIGCESDDETVKALAFTDTENPEKTVLIAVNMSENVKVFTLPAESYALCVTDAKKNMEYSEVNGKSEVTLPPRSVTTVVF